MTALSLYGDLAAIKGVSIERPSSLPPPCDNQAPAARYRHTRAVMLRNVKIDRFSALQPVLFAASSRFEALSVVLRRPRSPGNTEKSQDSGVFGAKISLAKYATLPYA
jgi:hypothetical protein